MKRKMMGMFVVGCFLLTSLFVVSAVGVQRPTAQIENKKFSYTTKEDDNSLNSPLLKYTILSTGHGVIKEGRGWSEELRHLRVNYIFGTTWYAGAKYACKYGILKPHVLEASSFSGFAMRISVNRILVLGYGNRISP